MTAQDQVSPRASSEGFGDVRYRSNRVGMFAMVLKGSAFSRLSQANEARMPVEFELVAGLRQMYVSCWRRE